LYRLLRLHVPHALLCPQLHLRALFAFLSSVGSTLEVLKVPPSPLSSFTGMDPNWDVDSNKGLQSLQGHVQVPEQLQQALLDTGIASISDFAYAYIDAQDLSDFVSKLPSPLWEQLRITDPDHSPAVARLCRTLDMRKQAAKHSDDASLPSGPSAPPSTLASDMWAEHAEHALPRLDAEAAQRMQSKFKANYPGEH
ncbi:unnamed protein product, partial [Symbiodinium pilosum]